MNKINILKIEELLSKIIILLAFLMPMFFLPTTTEFFEFNKLALLFFTTAVLTSLWAYKVISNRELNFIKSLVDLPLLLVVISTILSSVFSIAKETSIFGSQGRWFPSLYGVIVLYFFYNAIVSNAKSTSQTKSILLALVSGISLNTLVAILGYYGINIISLPSIASTQNFNLTGSVTTTGLIAMLAAIVSTSLMLYEKTPIKRTLLMLIVILNFYFAVLLASTASLVMLGLGVIAILLFVNKERFAINRPILSVLFGTIIAIGAILYTPTTKGLLVNTMYPKEIALSYRESWLVATSTIQNYPLFATGPSTFYLDFPRFRPLSLNTGEAWNLRFDKPYNEIFNTIATLGIVGLVATIFLILRYIKAAFIVLRSNDEDGIGTVLGIASISFVSIYLFTYATVLNTFISVLLLALTIAFIAEKRLGKRAAEQVSMNLSSANAITTTITETSVIGKEYLGYILMAPVLAVVLYGSYVSVRLYMGEYYSRQAITAALRNDGKSTFDYQAKAIQLNPQRHSYHNSYVQTSLALANNIASKENLSDAEKQTIQQLIAQAIKNVRLSTEVLNPLNVASWELRAEVYRALIPVAQNAAEFSIKAYNTAIQLDPTNPRLRLNLGSIYYASGDYLTAGSLYRQAISLKQDYANAHYNFAQALIKLQDYPNAKIALETTKTLVTEGTPDYEAVERDLASLPQTQAETKPTVEQIETTVAEEKKPATQNTQEPLTNAGETEVKSNAAPVEQEAQ